MKAIPKFGTALTIINLLVLAVMVVLAVVVMERRPTAQSDPQVLRGRGLELVDARGQIRAEFRVEPDGEAVFRLRDGSGAIRVKMGAGPTGSGLVLLDETTEPAVQMLARRQAGPERPGTTSIRLKGANAQERVITP